MNTLLYMPGALWVLWNIFMLLSSQKQSGLQEQVLGREQEGAHRAQPWKSSESSQVRFVEKMAPTASGKKQ